jgi:hypothetical protein
MRVCDRLKKKVSPAATKAATMMAMGAAKSLKNAYKVYSQTTTLAHASAQQRFEAFGFAYAVQ